MSKADYPAMIYHPVNKPKIINNDNEWEEHKDDSWSKVPYTNSLDMLTKKKVWHEKQLEDVKKKINEITGTSAVSDTENVSKNQDLSGKNENTDDVIFAGETKKRGRPKKNIAEVENGNINSFRRYKTGNENNRSSVSR
jgi:hypothetical protein